MARNWLFDFKGFAKKVKNTTLSTADQIKDCGAFLECPQCRHRIDNNDVSSEWPGFPVGVKFDPSDVELLQHLAAKCGIENREPHMFIHEFIPTLEGNQGICYTHPENLPGAKKDGSNVHFFHRTVNAYSTGQRKRRKIHHHDVTEEHVRWHKTGKTKAVIDNGEHKGFKKIMVLYVRSLKGSKPHKSNWVMHQYHLGSEEDEKDGEYVVSKIFYQQQKQIEKIKENPRVEDSEIALQTGPSTPIPNPASRPHTGIFLNCDAISEADELPSLIQDAKSIPGELHGSLCDVKDENNISNPSWLAGESQEVSEFDGLELDDISLCKDMLNSSAFSNESGLNYGISVLDNLEFDMPPDFGFSNFQFCSQDSILQWMDRI